jgi:hypothetical protein
MLSASNTSPHEERHKSPNGTEQIWCNNCCNRRTRVLPEVKNNRKNEKFHSSNNLMECHLRIGFNNNKSNVRYKIHVS